jgi:hypothetical protein
MLCAGAVATVAVVVFTRLPLEQALLAPPGEPDAQPAPAVAPSVAP